MSYSTIIPKLGKCTDCNDGVEKEVIAGRCKLYHYKPYRTKITLEKQKERLKVRGLRSLTANKEMTDKIMNIGTNEQELWFKMVATIISHKPYCWEDGTFISQCDYRSASAHILPKSIFPSVATHPLNFLVLSPRTGAHDKTHRLDTFSKMKVFKLAVERFRQFEHLIKEKHRTLDTFREYANKLEK